jgi:hypothetical protein
LYNSIKQVFQHGEYFKAITQRASQALERFNPMATTPQQHATFAARDQKTFACSYTIIHSELWIAVDSATLMIAIRWEPAPGLVLHDVTRKKTEGQKTNGVNPGQGAKARFDWSNVVDLDIVDPHDSGALFPNQNGLSVGQLAREEYLRLKSIEIGCRIACNGIWGKLSFSFFSVKEALVLFLTCPHCQCLCI